MARNASAGWRVGFSETLVVVMVVVAQASLSPPSRLGQPIYSSTLALLEKHGGLDKIVPSEFSLLREATVGSAREGEKKKVGRFSAAYYV